MGLSTIDHVCLGRIYLALIAAVLTCKFLVRNTMSENIVLFFLENLEKPVKKTMILCTFSNHSPVEEYIKSLIFDWFSKTNLSKFEIFKKK